MKGLQNVPSPYCAILYGSNPMNNPDIVGIVACGSPSIANTWGFSQSSIEDFGLQSLQSYSTGTSYVKLGDATYITLYDGDDLSKDSFNKISLGPGKEYDLIKYKLDAKLDNNTWNDRPLSFALSYRV